MKERIAELPTLRFPNFNQLFVVECDASKLVIGAMLSLFALDLVVFQ